MSAEELLLEYAKSNPAIEEQARLRYSSTESYQAQLQAKYQDMHHWYKPMNGDHWPADKVKRPGKIHVTANVCRPVVEIDARLQSILPRFTIPSSALSPDQRKRAEATETIMRQWMEMSGIEVWLTDLCRCKSIYGKGVLKPYWDDNLKRGDVVVVENPANLRLGYGSSDYTHIDWAIYEYSISKHEVKQRWPKVRVEPGMRHDDPPNVIVQGSSHDDPLAQKSVDEFWRPRYRQYSDYERSQVRVWDYWYKTEDGTVMNVSMLEGKVVDGPHAHKHLPDIPYIVIENDHEPGNPEGISTIEDLIDLQEELNRLLSHGLQHIADDVDPAWYITGPTASALDPGIVPKAGQAVGLGENEAKEWPNGVNTFPIQEMMGAVWEYIRRETGISDIAFGDMPGADTSGRAVAIQVESMMNRLDPRRRRLYRGLAELLVFWVTMAERKDPKGLVDEERGDVGLASIVEGFTFWRIMPPEITPRDSFEMTRNEIDKVNAKLSSLRTSMDQTGIEAPEHELSIIASEHNNLDIHPESVQIKYGVHMLGLQIQQMGMQLEQMQQQMAAQAQQGQPQSILAQAQSASNQAQNVLQGAQPGGAMEDQNQPGGPGRPMTQAGSPPPAGAGQQASGTATQIDQARSGTESGPLRPAHRGITDATALRASIGLRANVPVPSRPQLRPPEVSC